MSKWPAPADFSGYIEQIWVAFARNMCWLDSVWVTSAGQSNANMSPLREENALQLPPSLLLGSLKIRATGGKVRWQHCSIGDVTPPTPHLKQPELQKKRSTSKPSEDTRYKPSADGNSEVANDQLLSPGAAAPWSEWRCRREKSFRAERAAF